MKRLTQDQSGFTLIEVLVAAIVLVIAFAALATVFIGGESQASSQVQEVQLTEVADQQIEQIRADVRAEGFAGLALSAVPTVATRTVVQSTWANPNTFVESGTGSCGYAGGGTDADFEIAQNYDDVTTSGAAPYGSVPYGFTPWSGCNQAEPLEVIPSGTTSPLISVGGAEANCGSSQITSPCAVSENGNQFDVYTFVTDTYAGCNTGLASTNTTYVCPTGVSVAAVPSSANPVLTSTCTAQSTGTGTFGTTTTASTPCADARRVVVAVVPSNQQSLNATSAKARLARITPVYLSTIFTNPTPAGSSASGTVGLVPGGTI